MLRWQISGVVICTLAFVGCGGSNQLAGTSGSSTATAKVTTDGAVETVNQFLDAIRRGGGDSAAANLLTATARKECENRGIMIQPIGSPQAKYEVTRGEAIPGRTDAALVHSLWTEPGEQGPQTHEVLWAVKFEAGHGWRVSGMVVEQTKGQPMAIDFENGEELARIMGMGSSGPAAQTAASPASQAAPR
jgi:hypothetical protein